MPMAALANQLRQYDYELLITIHVQTVHTSLLNFKVKHLVLWYYFNLLLLIILTNIVSNLRTPYIHTRLIISFLPVFTCV